MSDKTETIILGGGPAGMACAMELHKANKTSVIVEKMEQVGGLAKTLEFHEESGVYRTDIGPHRFFSKNPYLYEFVEDLLGEEWIEVNRLTRFCVNRKYYLYPIKLRQALLQMGPWKSFRVLTDYLWEVVRRYVAPRKMDSFESYVLANFGRTLAEFNMLNYTEKIWGIPCSQISVDWAQQRIKGLSITTTLKKAIMGSSNAKSLVDCFYYPENGTGTIYTAIAKRIEEGNSTIHRSSVPTKISTDNGKVTGIAITTPEGETQIKADNVVSSIPITELIELFDPVAPKEIVDAVKSLRFRNQVYLFLIVDKESITDDNWLYYPDKDIPFGRLSEMKNFSKKMCPEGKTSLFIEFFVFENDEIWNMPKDDLYELAITWLEKLKLLTRKDVLNYHYYAARNVYPIYDLDYQEKLESVLSWCDQFTNLQLVGRPGRFRYTNQDHSLEMGMLAARGIIEGKAYDIGSVGSEQEYFEKGKLKDS